MLLDIVGAGLEGVASSGVVGARVTAAFTFADGGLALNVRGDSVWFHNDVGLRLAGDAFDGDEEVARDVARGV